jgi:hypothetical protein
MATQPSRPRTLWDVKDMIEKERKASGNSPLAAKLIGIYNEMEAAQEERKAAFVEHTPVQSFSEEDLPSDVVTPMMSRIDAISAERNALPKELTQPTITGKKDLDKWQEDINAYAEGGGLAPIGQSEVALLQMGEGIAPAIGEGIVEGVKFAGSILGTLTPDAIEKPTVELANEVLWEIGHSEWVDDFSDAVAAGSGAIKKWFDLNPKEARKASALFNTAALVSDVVPAGRALQVGGSAMSLTARRSGRTKKLDDIENLLTPTQAELAKTPRNVRGITVTAEGGKKSCVPSESEVERFKELARVPNLKPKAAAGFNFERAFEQQTKLSERILTNIDKAGNPDLDPEFVSDMLKMDLDDLAAAPEFTSVGGNPAILKPLLEKAQSLMAQSDGSTKGLLKARQGFDKWLKEADVSAFDGAVMTSRKQGAKAIRDRMTMEMSKNVDETTKAILTRQKNLYASMDELYIKQQTDLPNAIGQVYNWVREKSGYSLPRTIPQASGTFAVLGLGATSAVWGYGLSGLGGLAAGLAIKKFVMNPKTRQITGNMLQKLGKVIEKTDDPVLREAMRAEKAVLVYYLSEQEKKDKKAKAKP